MNNQGRREDPVILKQKIIYFQSELTTYKRKVAEYEKKANTKEITRLIEENALLKEKQGAIEEIERERDNLLKENQALKELIEQYERKEYMGDHLETETLDTEASIKENWFYHNLMNQANQVNSAQVISKKKEQETESEKE